MDDRYAINLAKTKFREGFNTGDIERVMSVYAEGVLEMWEGEPTFGGPDAHHELRYRWTKLFREYQVEMAPMVADIVLHGDSANVWGWHKFWLTPKAGGERVLVKYRFVEVWGRQKDGTWKVVFAISGKEHEPRMAKTAA